MGRLRLQWLGSTESPTGKPVAAYNNGVQFLKQVPLDFCFSSGQVDAQETAKQILQSQSYSTVDFQVLAGDLPRWQRVILTQRSMIESVVAHNTSLTA